jgi:hypothetical protein
MRPDQLLGIRNFGPRALQELRERLQENGYTEGPLFSGAVPEVGVGAGEGEED